jgi:predicted site-specific integrase-resolvase
MHDTPPADHTVADLARTVNCLDEEGFAKLAGVKPSTLDAWRKRGKGPEYVLLGNNYLYPIEAVKRYILELVRPRTTFHPRQALL